MFHETQLEVLHLFGRKGLKPHIKMFCSILPPKKAQEACTLELHTVFLTLLTHHVRIYKMVVIFCMELRLKLVKLVEQWSNR